MPEAIAMFKRRKPDYANLTPFNLLKSSPLFSPVCPPNAKPTKIIGQYLEKDSIACGFGGHWHKWGFMIAVELDGVVHHVPMGNHCRGDLPEDVVEALHDAYALENLRAAASARREPTKTLIAEVLTQLKQWKEPLSALDRWVARLREGVHDIMPLTNLIHDGGEIYEDVQTFDYAGLNAPGDRERHLRTRRSTGRVYGVEQLEPPFRLKRWEGAMEQLSRASALLVSDDLVTSYREAEACLSAAQLNLKLLVKTEERFRKLTQPKNLGRLARACHWQFLDLFDGPTLVISAGLRLPVPAIEPLAVTPLEMLEGRHQQLRRVAA